MKTFDFFVRVRAAIHGGFVLGQVKVHAPLYRRARRPRHCLSLSRNIANRDGLLSKVALPVTASKLCPSLIFLVCRERCSVTCISASRNLTHVKKS
jgi:hypothetical protein